MLLVLAFVAFGVPSASGGAVQVLETAMVGDRCFVLGVSCVRCVEIVL